MCSNTLYIYIIKKRFKGQNNPGVIEGNSAKYHKSLSFFLFFNTVNLRVKGAPFCRRKSWGCVFVLVFQDLHVESFSLNMERQEFLHNINDTYNLDGVPLTLYMYFTTNKNRGLQPHPEDCYSPQGTTDHLSAQYRGRIVLILQQLLSQV